MRMMWQKKLGVLFVAVLVLCAFLAGCSTELKETTVQGIDSAITVKLPGELKKDDTKFPVDPTMQKYLKGQQLYRVDDNNLSVIILAMGIDSSSYKAVTGQEISVSMQKPVSLFVKTVLTSMKGKNAKITTEKTGIAGKDVEINTVTFDADGKNMGMKVIAFQNKDAYWVVIPVYQTGDKDVEKAADDLAKSIKVKE